jgi:hypothetical protein
MLEEFTTSTFSDCVGESFSLIAEDDTKLELELVSVTPAATVPTEGESQRAPFSLVFHGPREPLLPQRIYQFESESLGTFEVFIVPIGYDESGSLEYEAVFG